MQDNDERFYEATEGRDDDDRDERSRYFYEHTDKENRRTITTRNRRAYYNNVDRRTKYNSGIRVPRFEWVSSPFCKLLYKGTRDRQNVVIFIRELQNIVKQEKIDESEQLHWLKKMLYHNVKAWFRLKNPKNIEDAFSALKEKFWSAEIQTEFRKNLFNCRYSANMGVTMGEYAMDIIDKSKMLDQPINNKMIIYMC